MIVVILQHVRYSLSEATGFYGSLSLVSWDVLPCPSRCLRCGIENRIERASAPCGLHRVLLRWLVVLHKIWIRRIQGEACDGHVRVEGVCAQCVNG